MATMDQERIAVTRDGTVAVITIDYPERRNAMSRAMRKTLGDTLHQLMFADSQSRALVITGAGGQFSAGADISEMGKRTILQGREVIAEACEIVRDLVSGPKPVVAAVEGVAFGAGLSLAVAADFLVAASDARLCASFLRVGLSPDFGICWTLPTKIGMSKARELLSLATEIDGAEAGRIGLANQVVGHGGALGAAIEVARGWARNPPMSMAFIKAGLTFGADTLEASLRTEIDCQPILRQSRDHREAVRASVEKRGAVFIGQ